MAINFSEKQLNETNIDSKENNQTEEKKTIDKINDFLLKLSRVPLKERLFFVRNLSIMLKTGISIAKGIKTLSEQTKNKYFIFILTDIANNIEAGKSFSEALAPHKKIFGELFIGMVEAGEISGKLEEVLNELYLQMKKEHAIMSKVKGALTYPSVILIAMLGIGTFMIIFVVPKITSMFTELNAKLPLATRILITVSDTLVKHGIVALISLIIFVIIFSWILKTEKGKYIFQGILLKTPIIGPITKKINLARFSRNISSLLKTDIMIIKTFQITANVLGNLHYRDALLKMAQKIKKGGKLNEVIKSYPHLFTPMVAQMVAVGEETGELDNILVELAEFYEEEVDQIMNNLPSIIEPILILVLGVGVGAMAVAIIMPMYSLTSAI